MLLYYDYIEMLFSNIVLSGSFIIHLTEDTQFMGYDYDMKALV